MSEDKIEVNMNVYDIPILVEALEEANKEIERLQEELKYTIPIVEHNQTIQSNIKSYNKLAEYSKELEDRIDELNNINEKISLALESAENRIDKAIKYIEDTSYKSYFSMLQADYNMSLDTLINILKGK